MHREIYPLSVATLSVRSGSKVTRNPSWLQNRLSSPITSGLVLLVVRSKISLLTPSHRLAASCAMATHRSARYVQLAKSAIESRVVGVAGTNSPASTPIHPARSQSPDQPRAPHPQSWKRTALRRRSPAPKLLAPIDGASTPVHDAGCTASHLPAAHGTRHARRQAQASALADRLR
jgi:hypothetical protein